MSDTNISRTGRALRVAVIDGDSGFVQVLTKRLDRLGWEHRVLTGARPGRPPRRDAPRRARHRPRAARPARVGVPRARRRASCRRCRSIVCTGQSTVAQRVRGLRLGADDWVDEALPPGGADRAHRGRRAPPPPGRRPGRRRGRRWPARSRSAPTSSRPSRTAARSTSRGASSSSSRCCRRADGRVLEREEIYQRVWGYTMAHGDRSVDVFVRKLRSKLAAGLAGLELHPHALRRRLPLRGGARGRGRRTVAGVAATAAGCRRRRRAPAPPAPSRGRACAGRRAATRRARCARRGRGRSTSLSGMSLRRRPATSGSSSCSRSSSGSCRAAARARDLVGQMLNAIFIVVIALIVGIALPPVPRRDLRPRRPVALRAVRRRRHRDRHGRRSRGRMCDTGAGAVIWVALIGACVVHAVRRSGSATARTRSPLAAGSGRRGVPARSCSRATSRHDRCSARFVTRSRVICNDRV